MCWTWLSWDAELEPSESFSGPAFRAVTVLIASFKFEGKVDGA